MTGLNEYSIEVEGLTAKWRGKFDLKGFNQNHPLELFARTGEWIGICGQNGIGKSTLLKVFSGHMPFYLGKVNVSGNRLKPAALIQRYRLGIFSVQQQPMALANIESKELHLFQLHHLTYPRYVPFELKLAKELNDFVNLPEINNTLIPSDAWDMRRAFELYTAITSFPRVLLLDEIGILVNQSDSESKQNHQIEFYSFIKSNVEGSNVFFIEHNFDIVKSISDRILFLSEDASPILGSPKDPGFIATVEKNLNWKSANQIIPQRDPGLVTTSDSESVVVNDESIYFIEDETPHHNFDLCNRMKLHSNRNIKKFFENASEKFVFLKENRPARTLSGGQQRVLTICISLALSSSVLIVTDPHQQLDIFRYERLEELIRLWSDNWKIRLVWS